MYSRACMDPWRNGGRREKMRRGSCIKILQEMPLVPYIIDHMVILCSSPSRWSNYGNQ